MKAIEKRVEVDAWQLKDVLLQEIAEKLCGASLNNWLMVGADGRAWVVPDEWFREEYEIVLASRLAGNSGETPMVERSGPGGEWMD